MPLVTDYTKRIIEAVEELKVIEIEIAENEICPKLKKKRVEALQVILDNSRPALVLYAAELRRYRTGCTDCLRCSDDIEKDLC